LATLAEANPLSGASDMIRSILLPKLFSFSYFSLLYIGAFSAIFTFTAAFAYMKILERK
jgi:ABC-type polysaccharide/polyol phosphate export permease